MTWVDAVVTVEGDKQVMVKVEAQDGTTSTALSALSVSEMVALADSLYHTAEDFGRVMTRDEPGYPLLPSPDGQGMFLKVWFEPLVGEGREATFN